MESKLHALPLQNMNDSPPYDNLKNDFHLQNFNSVYVDNHNYSHYNNINADHYKFMDSNMNIPTADIYGAKAPPSYKMVNYNNNITLKEYDQRTKNGHGNYGTNSPCKGCDSDSYSSSGTFEGDSFKQPDSKEKNNYGGPGVYQLNLYRPTVYHSKNSRICTQTSRRNQNNKAADMMTRRAHGLMERFKSRAYKLKINPNPPDLLNGGPWDQLNQAIFDVFLSKIQKEETYVKKLDLWKSIFLFIRKCFNSYSLFLFGSTMSGFGLEGSDMDMCLLTKPLINEPRVDSLHHLSQLKQLLLDSGIANSAELIMAKVPILKFTNGETGFEIDLNCNNSVGIRNTHMLHSYAQLDWRVRPLVVIVKLWAQANHINDAKNMTISSYSWALMVINYLQCGVSPPVLPCLHGLIPEKFNSLCDNMDIQEEIDILKDFESNNTSCLGDLLIGFFHYYSYFDYSQFAISVRTGARLSVDQCKFFKSPKNDPHQWKFLCIEEPFDFSNTARSVFDIDVFRRIKHIVLCSYKELASNKNLLFVLPVDPNNHR